MFRQIVPATLLVLMFTAEARSQDCNPKDFTYNDIERVRLDRTTRLMATSLLDASHAENRNRNFEGNAIIYGVPVGLSASDAKAVSQHVLQKSSIDFSDDVKYDYVRSALSLAGVEMYKDCLATRRIKFDSTGSPTSREILFRVRWIPGRPVTRPGKIEFATSRNARVVRVDNNAPAGRIRDNTPTQYKLIRTDNKEAHLGIAIESEDHPFLKFPPIIEPVEYEMVLRRGYGDAARTQGGDLCTDHAYLVAEYRSAAGNNSKYCDLCVVASADGILLPSTAKIQGAQEGGGIHAALDPANSTVRACGKFSVDGPGNTRGIRREIRRGTFEVFEAIPRIRRAAQR